MSHNSCGEKKMSDRTIDLGFGGSRERGAEKPYLLSCRVDDETVQWLQGIKNWMDEKDLPAHNKSDVVRKAIQFGSIYLKVLDAQQIEREEAKAKIQIKDLVDSEKSAAEVKK